MPTLPADLSDPRSREIAVHCVHQIRTLLQIGSAREQGSAICVTGPGVATGKTTLSLALGLSFGTSGTRTLLVDADLAGRGLTRRIGRMLLAHLRRVAEGSAGEPGEDGAGPASDRHSHLLDPLDQRQFGPQGARPDDVVAVLSRAIDRLGFAGARDAGVVAQVFEVADLLFQGDVRADLVSRLDHHLAAAAAHAGEVVPPLVRHLELTVEHPEFNGDPVERYLYSTGVDTLRFLPLRGLGTGGGVSAAGIARILDRVRREVDVALVDTGPVFGAVETPMVAAHADSVLLVVSPSDQRPEAESVVAQMEVLGARIAGVVFNRAGSRDVLRASRSRSSVSPPDEGGA
jgi:Mrp family chromosome partitioning ATPase